MTPHRLADEKNEFVQKIHGKYNKTMENKNGKIHRKCMENTNGKYNEKVENTTEIQYIFLKIHWLGLI